MLRTFCPRIQLDDALYMKTRAATAIMGLSQGSWYNESFHTLSPNTEQLDKVRRAIL